MPPPLVGEALAFRDVFQQAPVSFIENETSLPRALLLGELSSGCETERLDKGRRWVVRKRLCHPAPFPEPPETDEIPETPANATVIVVLIYPTRVCFARVSRHKSVTFCGRSAQTLGGYIGQSLQEMVNFGQNRAQIPFLCPFGQLHGQGQIW